MSRLDHIESVGHPINCQLVKDVSLPCAVEHLIREIKERANLTKCFRTKGSSADSRAQDVDIGDETLDLFVCFDSGLSKLL